MSGGMTRLKSSMLSLYLCPNLAGIARLFLEEVGTRSTSDHQERISVSEVFQELENLLEWEKCKTRFLIYTFRNWRRQSFLRWMSNGYLTRIARTSSALTLPLQATLQTQMIGRPSLQIYVKKSRNGTPAIDRSRRTRILEHELRS